MGPSGPGSWAEHGRLAPSLPPSLPALQQPGLAELPGRQRQGRDASRLRIEGLFPVSIYANERRFRSTKLS